MSDKKHYYMLYKELKENIVLLQNYVDFYTREEQSDFLLKGKIG